MSVYEECIDAARKLLADPSLHSREHRGFFTDLDVIALAAQTAGDYSDARTRVALGEASMVLTKLYKRGQVARFGPVQLPGLEPDYARIATKIVYAHPTDGPASFDTPNGSFRRLLVVNDHGLRAGRRHGTNRDDRLPWDKRDLAEARIRAQLAKTVRG